MDDHGVLINVGNYFQGIYFNSSLTLLKKKNNFLIRLKDFGMNTYLYAPKDDSKHRAYWRELYSVEEGEALKTLIESANDNNINFIYAISPGLDVTYSNDKDQMILKRKLDQVKQFGCKYFALLFDDIDNEMQQADKCKFK
jgi:protein O-GlcNAcase/histone acetyltransferase